MGSPLVLSTVSRIDVLRLMQKQYKELTSKQTLQMQWNENELVTRR